MSQFGDLSSSQAYQENVAQPDERAWAREANEARRLAAVVIEQLVSKETGQVIGYRCVHNDNGERIPQAIVVGLESGQQVLVDVCYVCLHNLKAAQRG